MYSDGREIVKIMSIPFYLCKMIGSGRSLIQLFLQYSKCFFILLNTEILYFKYCQVKLSEEPNQNKKTIHHRLTQFCKRITFCQFFRMQRSKLGEFKKQAEGFAKLIYQFLRNPGNVRPSATKQFRVLIKQTGLESFPYFWGGSWYSPHPRRSSGSSGRHCFLQTRPQRINSCQ